ncbi:hypothetical protein CLF_111533, partial [Clonorchis sinensis]
MFASAEEKKVLRSRCTLSSHQLMCSRDLRGSRVERGSKMAIFGNKATTSWSWVVRGNQDRYRQADVESQVVSVELEIHVDVKRRLRESRRNGGGSAESVHPAPPVTRFRSQGGHWSRYQTVQPCAVYEWPSYENGVCTLHVDKVFVRCLKTGVQKTLVSQDLRTLLAARYFGPQSNSHHERVLGLEHPLSKPGIVTPWFVQTPRIPTLRPSSANLTMLHMTQFTDYLPIHQQYGTLLRGLRTLLNIIPPPGAKSLSTKPHLWRAGPTRGLHTLDLIFSNDGHLVTASVGPRFSGSDDCVVSWNAARLPEQPQNITHHHRLSESVDKFPACETAAVLLNAQLPPTSTMNRVQCAFELNEDTVSGQ